MSESGEGESYSPPTLTEGEAEFLRWERETTRPIDPELLRLVHLINALDPAGAEIGITLHIKGCLVSGMLIPIAQYYRLLIRGFTERLSEHSSQEAGEGFAEFYRPSLEAIVDNRERDEPLAPPRHIHLRHAQTYLGGQEPFTQPVWRGRLAEVDAWSVGNFGPIPPLEDDPRSPTS